MQSPNSSPASGQGPIVAQIDLHCHLLPEWDDGPPTLDASLTMARRFAEKGMTHIVVTPHVGRAFNGVEHPAETIPPAVARLQEELNSNNIPLTLISGAEVLLGVVDWGTKEINRNMTVGGNGKYALVESPYRHWPDFAENALYQLSLAGVIPIIAHPERYSQVLRDVAILEKPVNSGALLQITAGNLVGENGPQLQAVCEQLLQLGWVAFVSSDAHTTAHTVPAEVVNRVVELVGERQARAILMDNPRRVIENENFRYGPMRSLSEVRRTQKKEPLWRKFLRAR